MIKNIPIYLIILILVSSCENSLKHSVIKLESKQVKKEFYSDPVSSIISCNLNNWDGSNSYVYSNERNIEISFFYSNKLVEEFGGNPAYLFIGSTIIDSIEIENKSNYVLDSIYIPFEATDEHHFIVTPNRKRKYGLGLTELRLQFYKNGSKKAERMFKL